MSGSDYSTTVTSHTRVVIDVPPGAILNFEDPDGIALAILWDR